MGRRKTEFKFVNLEGLFQTKREFEITNPKEEETFIKNLRKACGLWADQYPHAPEWRKAEIQREYSKWVEIQYHKSLETYYPAGHETRFDPGSTYWSVM